MEPTTDAAITTAIVSASPTSIRLVALDPVQLQRSQAYLIQWATQKIASVQEEVNDSTSNLEIATKAKWNTARPKAHLGRAKGRLVFYEKLRDALEAGFYIVPDMPCDLFAIRTTKEEPAARTAEAGSSYLWDLVTDEKPQLLLSGEGEYRNPVPTKQRNTFVVTNDKNQEEKRFRFEATGFQEIVFPFALAKPEVLNATQRAMALKIFDEIGVCPASRKKDPMVLGIIKQPKRGWAPAKQITFLIAWFLDTDML